MAVHRLVCHPQTPSTAIDRIDVEIVQERDGAHIAYRMTGRPEHVVAALRDAGRPPARRDGLWRSTCCELFVSDAEGPGYYEYNFAPCGDWAAYRFSGYRAGGSALDARTPRIELERSQGGLVLHAELTDGPLVAAVRGQRIALACVVETAAETSCWALAHPPGRPDFHHSIGFAVMPAVLERSAG